jgi:hypothetical protein
MLAGLFPSGKNRQPAISSSLLILILAVASFLFILLNLLKQTVNSFLADF